MCKAGAESFEPWWEDRVVGKWLFVAEFVAGCALIIIFASAIGKAEMWGVDAHYLVNTILYNCLLGWWGAYLIISVVAIIETVRWVRRDNLTGLCRAMLLVKLTSVGFFVLNFFFGVLVALGSMLVGTVIVVPITYLLLLPTSAYGIGCLVLLRRRGAIPRWFFGINLALHFLFVLDILSTIAVAITAALRDRPAGAGRVPGPPPAADARVTGPAGDRQPS